MNNIMIFTPMSPAGWGMDPYCAAAQHFPNHFSVRMFSLLQTLGLNLLRKPFCLLLIASALAVSIVPISEHVAHSTRKFTKYKGIRLSMLDNEGWSSPTTNPTSSPVCINIQTDDNTDSSKDITSYTLGTVIYWWVIFIMTLLFLTMIQFFTF